MKDVCCNKNKDEHLLLFHFSRTNARISNWSHRLMARPLLHFCTHYGALTILRWCMCFQLLHAKFMRNFSIQFVWLLIYDVDWNGLFFVWLKTKELADRRHWFFLEIQVVWIRKLITKITIFCQRAKQNDTHLNIFVLNLNAAWVFGHSLNSIDSLHKQQVNRNALFKIIMDF